MELVEAINKRKTCRGFKTDPVPQDILQEIMTNSLRAPSWGNTQPWEFAIATGKPLEEIKQGFADAAAEAPAPDLKFPSKFPDSYLSRLPNRPRPPADRSDTDLRTERQLNSAQLYKTPCIIYIYTEREMYEQENYNNVYAVFDCGLIAQNICLLAVPHGLSTVIAAQAVRCPEVIKEKLGIPDTKLIVLGIGIGYPDPDHPQYSVYSSREPLDKVSKWYGFD